MPDQCCERDHDHDGNCDRHPPGTVAKLQAELAACREERDQLSALYAPFAPMALADAEAALDAIDAEKITDEQAGHSVKYATDPAYRAECLKERYQEMFRIARGLREGANKLQAERDAAVAERDTLTELVIAFRNQIRNECLRAEAAESQLTAFREQREKVVGVVRNLLESADASWEENNGGHDWPDACKAARELLSNLKGT
jgi:hypothetical protein